MTKVSWMKNPDAAALPANLRVLATSCTSSDACSPTTSSFVARCGALLFLAALALALLLCLWMDVVLVFEIVAREEIGEGERSWGKSA